MPFHRDSAKEIETLIKTYPHYEKEILQDQELYNKYFSLYVTLTKKKIQNVLDYLYTVDAIIPFFLKGLLGEAPKFQFIPYENFIKTLPTDPNDSTIFSRLLALFQIPKEEYDIYQHDLFILFKNISYFEYKLNIVLYMVFERLARNASILPEFIIAKIASIALTPFMCANIIRFMKEQQIISLMKYFDIPFLAEVVNELDIEITQTLMKYVSPKEIEEIFKIMLQKEFYPKIASIFENFNGNIEIYKQAILKYISNKESIETIIKKIEPYFTQEEKLLEFKTMIYST